MISNSNRNLCDWQTSKVDKCERGVYRAVSRRTFQPPFQEALTGQLLIYPVLSHVTRTPRSAAAAIPDLADVSVIEKSKKKAGSSDPRACDNGLGARQRDYFSLNDRGILRRGARIARQRSGTTDKNVETKL